MKLPEHLNLSPSSSAPIFHVDDDQLVIAVADRYYQKSSLQNPYIAFTDGDSFLAELRRIRDEGGELPLLVLLDINMPGKDGFQVLEEMRACEAFRSIPLCSMLSSSTNRVDIEKSESLGADAYLVKPDNASEFQDFFSAVHTAVTH